MVILQPSHVVSVEQTYLSTATQFNKAW